MTLLGNKRSIVMTQYVLKSICMAPDDLVRVIILMSLFAVSGEEIQ